MSIFWQNRICHNLHFGQKLHFWHSVLLHCHRHWSSWYGVGMQYLNWGFRFHFLTSRGKSFFSRRTQCINDLLPISPWQTCQALFFSLFLFPLRRENKEAFSIPAGIRVIRVQKSKNHSFCSVLQIESTDCQGIPLLQPSEATFTFWVIRQVTFNKTKVGWKCQNSKTFLWLFSNYVSWCATSKENIHNISGYNSYHHYG